MSLYRFRHLHLRTGTSLLAVAATVAANGIFPVFQTSAADSTERVIIELEAPAAVDRVGERRAANLRADDNDARTEALKAYRAATEAIEAGQKDVVASVEANGIRLSDLRHTTGVLNAVIADVDSAHIDALRKSPGVARVSIDTQVSLLTGDDTDRDNKDKGSDPAPVPTPTATATDSAEPTDLRAPDPGDPAAGEATVAPDAAHGEGTTVAVLDTGIDYSLTDLGAGFGDGFKVIDGYDFVNDDADPMDDHYHGTHVAGIIAGTGAESVTGVAPAATLTAYKVLGSEGSGFLSWILAGVEAAADPTGDHPADVINMSLGAAGDGRDALGVAAGNVSKTGALVVAAAGNSGPEEGTIGSPAAADGVLAVGASITDFRIPAARIVAPLEHDVASWPLFFSANPPADGITADVVDVGLGTTEDFDRAGDVTGKVVVYQGAAPRGASDGSWIASLDTAKRAESRGALAGLEYRRGVPTQELDAYGEDLPGAQEAGVVDVRPSGAVTLDSGDDLRLDTFVVMGMMASEYSVFRDAVAEDNARLTLSSVDATDRIASFSSRGPTVHGQIKPEIVAPGYQIRSTVPASQGIPENAYRLSGTSMASPHVAGVAAIVQAQHPTLDPAALRSRLIGSAVPLSGGSHTLSPSIQGAGRVNIETATAAAVVASPDTLAFGQIDGVSSASMELTLSNPSDVALTAHLEVEPSAVSQGTLALSGSDVTLAPGATATVAVTATASVGAADSELSGVIVARASNGSEVRVPYLQMSRQLTVAATPEPSAGEVSILVSSSFLPLDEAPTVTVTGAEGEPFTVPTTPASSIPGWYKAEISTQKIGVYQVRATGHTGDRTVTGAGTFEVIAEATTNTAWQQLGRDASSAQLAVSPAAPGTAMQRTTTSVRPFVTTDHGQTWSHVRSLPVADGEGTLIADTSDGKSFWYALNGAIYDPPLDPSYNGKLLRTEDLGKTWELLPLPDKVIQAITNTGDDFAVVVQDGLEISSDGGESWKHVPFAWPEPVRASTVHDGDLFVSGYFSVWRVGDVFGDIQTPSLTHHSDDILTGIASTKDVLAVSVLGGVELSTDGGKSWRRDPTFEEGVFTRGITAVGNEFFIGNTEGYFRSADAGRTWSLQPVPVPIIPTDFDKWPDRRSSLLLPLEGAGLYDSTNDGKTFTRIGVAGTTIGTVIADTNAKGKPIVMIADDEGFGSIPLPTKARLRDDATEWGSTDEGEFANSVTHLEQDPTSKDTLWRVQANGNFLETIQRTVDGGATWSDGVGPIVYGSWFRDLEVSPTVAGHAVATYATQDENGMLVTQDGWQHWATYNHPISVRSVAIDPRDDSRLWIAADEGLYRSDDNGLTITQVFAGETATVWVDPNDANSVLVGGRGLWASSDGGATFSAGDAGGADMYVSSFASAPVPGTGKTVLFAGSTTFRPGPFLVHGRGVLASLDEGKSWSNVSAGIGTTSVRALDSSADGKWLLAGTRQGGLYRADIESLIPLVK